jgi:hypothetical protein
MLSLTLVHSNRILRAGFVFTVENDQRHCESVLRMIIFGDFQFHFEIKTFTIIEGMLRGEITYGQGKMLEDLGGPVDKHMQNNYMSKITNNAAYEQAFYFIFAHAVRTN